MLKKTTTTDYTDDKLQVCESSTVKEQLGCSISFLPELLSAGNMRLKHPEIIT